MKRNLMIITTILVTTILTLSVTTIPQVQSQTILKNKGKEQLIKSVEEIKNKISQKVKHFLNKIDIKNILNNFENKEKIKTLNYKVKSSTDITNMENQYCAGGSLIILLIIVIGFIIGILTWIPAVVISIPFSIILGIWISFLFFMSTQNLIFAILVGFIFGGAIIIGGVFWPITCTLLCIINSG